MDNYNDREESDQINQYNKVERWCKDQINNGSDFLFDPVLFQSTMKATSREFSFPLESLHSFFRSIHVKHIKSTSHKVRNNLQTKYINEYVHNGKSIIDLAKDANFSPALLTRRILEEVTNLDLGKKGALGAALKNPLEELGSIDMIKQEFKKSEEEWQQQQQQTDRLATDTDTTTTTTTRLALEVKEAVESDPLCGPASDRAKHYIGIEYEIILERGLKNLGIPFESEAQLRQKGSARTPDVVLSSPIGVQIGSEWQVVCWIDSKVRASKDENIKGAGSYCTIRNYIPKYNLIAEKAPNIVLIFLKLILFLSNSYFGYLFISVLNVFNLHSTQYYNYYYLVEKALYGDVDTHQTSVLPQAESYLHRFGPGMIVYWFGHAPLSKLGNVNGDLAIVGWKLPETILWPDG